MIQSRRSPTSGSSGLSENSIGRSERKKKIQIRTGRQEERKAGIDAKEKANQSALFR
jgi:hypothetical protein